VLLRPGAKREVLLCVLLASLAWGSLGFGLVVRFVGEPAAVVFGTVFALVVVLRYPLQRAAERVYADLVGRRGEAPPQLRNVADGLAVAIGVPAERVEIIDSPVPNVLALPTRSHGLVVVATSGVVGLLPRAELEALVASQVVVAGHSWVALASRVQRAQAPWVFVVWAAIPLSFLHPATMVMALLLTFGFLFSSQYRRADFVRDLVADSVAIHTTKNPEALVRALRSLRPATLVASKQKLGNSGMRADAFAVLSMRAKMATTTTVNGRSRSYATEDEIATELGFRAARMESIRGGDFRALESLGAFRQAWALLGTDHNPYALTPEERASADPST
jgi:Zn-dependent protease with chaperone function